MDKYRQGLAVDNLQPPQIVSFLQGLHRRLAERLNSLDPDDAQAHRDSQQRIDKMVDQLAMGIDRVESAGYPINEDVADYADAEFDTDTPARRLSAAAIELARRTSGVPNEGWNESPGLLPELQDTCAEVSSQLRQIGVMQDENDDGLE